MLHGELLGSSGSIGVIPVGNWKWILCRSGSEPVVFGIGMETAFGSVCVGSILKSQFQ